MSGRYYPERVLGIDGKRYPTRPPRGVERLRMIALVHALAHDGRSVRAVVAELAAAHGITRSVGSVSTYLTAYQCPNCSGGPPAPPEHPPERTPA